MIPKEILSEVILSQKNTLEKLDPGNLREKEKELKIDESFALVITGVRRCGKSTLLNHLLLKQKKGYYLNLEDPRLDNFELADFNKVEVLMKELYGKNGIYFFDEIQNISKWEKFIRYLIDKKERIVITGSNASLLSKELGTKLTGRHLQIELFPFSFNEFLNLKKENPSIASFEKYLYLGGFPEYLKKENPLIPQGLLTDIITKDVVVRFGIKNTGILTKITLFLVSNVGKEFSYNSIKKAFNVKAIQSVINYIYYLENTYLIFTIPRFSYSFKQQQVNPKKVYSIDNGLSYNTSTTFSKDKGKMLENVVFLGLRRKFKDIFYFQEKNECDFIIKERESITKAIQVCYKMDETNKEREINGLISAMLKFKLKEGMILTYDQEDESNIKGKKIIIKPVWKWLLNL